MRAGGGARATWSVSSAQSRALFLDRVHALILERAELFAQAISLEMGAAIGFARSTHVPSAAQHIRVARDNLASYAFFTKVTNPMGHTTCGQFDYYLTRPVITSVFIKSFGRLASNGEVCNVYCERGN